ncbi:MAG: hypothetical protein EBR86_06605 [Planctomycetia bacterium]|nr:hypothetical protein [Planctomycetia bacterium]
MTLVIGTDEAGYGPNLGPLVVAATAWHAADDDAPDAGTTDPAPRFDRATAALAAACGAAPWADSKRIYQPAGGLGPLETGVLAALVDCPADGRALADRLAIAVDPPAPPEWPRFLVTPLPVAAEALALERLREAVADVLPRHGLRLVAIRCRVVQPAAFNALLASGTSRISSPGPRSIWRRRSAPRRPARGLKSGATATGGARPTRRSWAGISARRWCRRSWRPPP